MCQLAASPPSAPFQLANIFESTVCFSPSKRLKEKTERYSTFPNIGLGWRCEPQGGLVGWPTVNSRFIRAGRGQGQPCRPPEEEAARAPTRKAGQQAGFRAQSGVSDLHFPSKPPFVHRYTDEGRMEGPPSCFSQHFAASGPQAQWPVFPSSRKATEPDRAWSPLPFIQSTSHQLDHMADQKIRERPLLDFSLPNFPRAFHQTQLKWKPKLKFKPKPTI